MFIFCFFFSDFDKGLDYSQLYQPEQHRQPDEDSQLNEIFIEIPAPHLRLDLCPVCSRKFAPESLMKHVIICEKINTKKRKPFDSSTQRLKGTEFIASSPTVSSTLPCPYERRISPPKTVSRWKMPNVWMSRQVFNPNLHSFLSYPAKRAFRVWSRSRFRHSIEPRWGVAWVAKARQQVWLLRLCLALRGAFRTRAKGVHTANEFSATKRTTDTLSGAKRSRLSNQVLSLPSCLPPRNEWKSGPPTKLQHWSELKLLAH